MNLSKKSKQAAIVHIGPKVTAAIGKAAKGVTDAVMALQAAMTEGVEGLETDLGIEPVLPGMLGGAIKDLQRVAQAIQDAAQVLALLRDSGGRDPGTR